MKTLKLLSAGVKFLKLAVLGVAAGGIVIFGRDVYTLFKGVRTEYSITGELLRNLPAGEYATREITVRVKAVARHELACAERTTLYHMKTGFDMAQVTVEKLPGEAVRINLGPVKLLSMEEIVTNPNVQRSMVASLAGMKDPEFSAPLEYEELLKQCAAQKLFDPALSVKSLEEIYLPILQETAGEGVDVAFVLPKERSAAEVLREYYARRDQIAHE